jgi:hypothetical protein
MEWLKIHMAVMHMRSKDTATHDIMWRGHNLMATYLLLLIHVPSSAT